MSGEGFCYKCREDLKNGRSLIFPSPHCHHEPKEKLSVDEIIEGGLEKSIKILKTALENIGLKEKSKCWCEREHRPFGQFVTLNGPLNSVEIIFCPQCGRKL